MNPAFSENQRVLTADAYLGTIRRVHAPQELIRKGKKDHHEGEAHYDVELDIGRERKTYSECQLTLIGGLAYDYAELGLKF
jgi:hypothetical protein